MKRVPARAEVRATQQAIRALDHPLRQRVLVLLHRERRSVSYTDISKLLGVKDTSQIARHLKVLVGAALVGNFLERGEGGRLASVYFLTEKGTAWLRKVEFTSPERARALLEA